MYTLHDLHPFAFGRKNRKCGPNLFEPMRAKTDSCKIKHLKWCSYLFYRYQNVLCTCWSYYYEWMTILLTLYDHVLLETSQQSSLCENDIVVTWEESWVMHFCPKKIQLRIWTLAAAQTCANFMALPPLRKEEGLVTLIHEPVTEECNGVGSCVLALLSMSRLWPWIWAARGVTCVTHWVEKVQVPFIRSLLALSVRL